MYCTGVEYATPWSMSRGNMTRKIGARLNWHAVVRQGGEGGREEEERGKHGVSYHGGKVIGGLDRANARVGGYVLCRRTPKSTGSHSSGGPRERNRELQVHPKWSAHALAGKGRG